MVIPDMLKNAPMFKRLDARVKVPCYFQVLKNSIFDSLLCFCILYFLNLLKGKGASLGVGRGRAVAMRAKVFFNFHL